MSFTVGDMAVYQGQGIGEITSISTLEVGGAAIEVYVVRILENGSTIRVPIKKASEVGLREIIDVDEVPEVYAILRDDAKRPKEKTWNRRYRNYMDKLKTGSVKEIAAVLRDLYRLKGDKDLSYGERKMLNQARNLLVKELSFATQRAENEIAQELEDLFAGEC